MGIPCKNKVTFTLSYCTRVQVLAFELAVTLTWMNVGTSSRKILGKITAQKVIGKLGGWGGGFSKNKMFQGKFAVKLKLPGGLGLGVQTKRSFVGRYGYFLEQHNPAIRSAPLKFKLANQRPAAGENWVFLRHLHFALPDWLW